ncbi:uncharacterized protein LOC108144482 [Drosophila elegans]|uniref:uncharacterized protein LOC108144482 n=1 Tax=Drosophila elegans TaxID=30023 RepID=UPI0007E6E6E6|nr:uncharacterized protein LOC108144482 [Drosophila elegans]
MKRLESFLKMKLLVALALLLAADFGAPFLSEHDPILKNCSTKKEAIKELTIENPTDENFKCYYNCLLELEEIIVNGKTVRPSQNNLDPNVLKCLDFEDDNSCELAYKIFKCLERRS